MKQKDQRIEIPPSSLQGQYAGFISRFLAYLIDILVVIFIVTGVGLVMDLIFSYFGLADVIANLESSTSIQGNFIRLITAFWGVTSIAFLYFTLSWTVTSGKTIGNGLIGLRIVPNSGERITLLRSIWRYIALLFSVFFFGIGIFWILVSDRRQGWHDKLADTCVIYDWPAREDVGVVERLQQRWYDLRHTRRTLRERRKRRGTGRTGE